MSNAIGRLPHNDGATFHLDGGLPGGAYGTATVGYGGHVTVELRSLTADDAAAVLRFAATLEGSA